MDIGGAVRIEYWAEADGKIGLFEPEGISEFKAELAAHYVSQVRGRPGALGGLYGLSIDFLTSFSLQHFLNLIVDGIAYDLVKFGSDALILRPFVAAYKALKQRNSERFTGLRIERLRLSFEDSTVLIHELREVELVSNLDRILNTLASHYKNLTLRSGEEPSFISIPVVEDPAGDRLSRPRAKTCCFFSSFKTLAMPTEPTSLRGIQCPGRYSRWPVFR